MTNLVPSRRRNLWPAMNPTFFRPSFEGLQRSQMMPTDIEKTDDGLDFTVSLPGFSKDDVEVELKDGYLSISAQTKSSEEKTEETQSGGKYIRRERFSGSCRRAFYVGDEIDEDAITAKFEGGVLEITVPFTKAEEQPEEKKVIAIEG